MLETDGYIFLDIKHPLVAWATYRGVLVSCQTARNQPGIISLMMANLLESSRNPRLFNELAIEMVRASRYPTKLSRMAGMFYFPERDSADRATAWGAHFCPEFLAEVHIFGVGKGQVFDSNWITYAPVDSKGYIIQDDFGWIDEYWKGTPFPKEKPVWEGLTEGRLVILGTQIREKSYGLVKEKFPESLGLLEMGRIAAVLGSDLGNISAFLIKEESRIRLEYYMDWRDANNPDYIQKHQEYIKSGGIVNRKDLQNNHHKGYDRVPDLTLYSFTRDIEARHIINGSLSLCLLGNN